MLRLVRTSGGYVRSTFPRSTGRHHEGAVATTARAATMAGAESPGSLGTTGSQRESVERTHVFRRRGVDQVRPRPDRTAAATASPIPPPGRALHVCRGQ